MPSGRSCSSPRWTLANSATCARCLLVVILVATFLTFRYVDEFLAVRALGILLLLLAEPLIEAAFLRPEAGRLLLVALAYAWPSSAWSGSACRT